MAMFKVKVEGRIEALRDKPFFPLFSDAEGYFDESMRFRGRCTFQLRTPAVRVLASTFQFDLLPSELDELR